MFLRPPATDMHNRMKETLVMLGRIEIDCQTPLLKLSNIELKMVRETIDAAGLTYEGAEMLKRRMKKPPETLLDGYKRFRSGRYRQD